jgi:hypothetical protein
VVFAGAQITECTAKREADALRFVGHLVATSISRFKPGSPGTVAVIVLRCGSMAGKKPALVVGHGVVELEHGNPSEIAARFQATVINDDVQEWQKGTPENGRVNHWPL